MVKQREHKTDGTPCWCNPKIIDYQKNELLNLAKRSLKLEKEENELTKKADKIWKEKDIIDKKISRIVRKGVPKRFKSIVIKNKEVRITLPIRYGWLKISKTR